MTVIPIQVTVDLPEDEVPRAVAGRRALARELRLLWVLDRVRRGRVSIGKGAQLAGMGRLPFLAAMTDHGMAAIAYPAEERIHEIDLLTAT